MSHYAINIDGKYCHVFLPEESISSLLLDFIREMSPSSFLSLFLVSLYIKSAEIVLYLDFLELVHVIKIQHRVEAGEEEGYPTNFLKTLGIAKDLP